MQGIGSLDQQCTIFHRPAECICHVNQMNKWMAMKKSDRKQSLLSTRGLHLWLPQRKVSENVMSYSLFYHSKKSKKNWRKFNLRKRWWVKRNQEVYTHNEGLIGAAFASKDWKMVTKVKSINKNMYSILFQLVKTIGEKIRTFYNANFFWIFLFFFLIDSVVLQNGA